MNRFLLVIIACSILGVPSAGLGTAGAQEAAIAPGFSQGQETEWQFVTGAWRMGEGVLEQQQASRGSSAILKEPAFSDLTLSVEFNIRPTGNGVRAAAILFRATGTMTYCWLHLDSKNNSVILVRTTPHRHLDRDRPQAFQDQPGCLARGQG